MGISDESVSCFSEACCKASSSSFHDRARQYQTFAVRRSFRVRLEDDGRRVGSRRFRASSGARLVALETVGVASASGIEEPVAQLRPAVEMPAELLAVASAVVGRHAAPLLGRHFLFFRVG